MRPSAAATPRLRRAAPWPAWPRRRSPRQSTPAAEAVDTAWLCLRWPSPVKPEDLKHRGAPQAVLTPGPHALPQLRHEGRVLEVDVSRLHEDPLLARHC